MKVIIGSDECTLLKYSEVADWFGVPEGYILTRIIVNSWSIAGRLKEINGLKLNEVVISKEDEDKITIFKELESFKKRFNLIEKFDVDSIILIPEDNNRVEELRYLGEREDLNHYLKEQPNDVYFKINKSYRTPTYCFKIPEGYKAIAELKKTNYGNI